MSCGVAKPALEIFINFEIIAKTARNTLNIKKNIHFILNIMLMFNMFQTVFVSKWAQISTAGFATPQFKLPGNMEHLSLSFRNNSAKNNVTD